MNCEHKNLKYFKYKELVRCLDCDECFIKQSDKNKRNDFVIERIITLRNLGNTFESIGKEVGLTRQRCHRIYKDYNN